MSAIVPAPNATADLIQQALTLVESDDDIWEPGQALAISLVAHIDAKRAGLGVLAGAVNRRYGAMSLERWAQGIKGVTVASLYDWARWVKIAGGAHEAIALIAKGYSYHQQRMAMRHAPDTETFLARLTGDALPDPDTPKRPRMVVDAHRATVCEVRGRFAIIDLGALAIDLTAGRQYRAVFYEIEGE